MRRLLFSFLLLAHSWALFGQHLKGVVLDQESGQPIDFASVFFSGTFVGTTTSGQGSFELDVGKYRNRPLSISAVGYHTLSIPEIDPQEFLKVSLKPKVFELDEVTVSTKSLVRKREACLRTFRREFIGTSSNAQKCHILNEEDISFNYGSDKDTLIAYASRPLRIMNLSLGYQITYHLDRFEYQRRTQITLYTGDIIFDRDLGDNEEDSLKFRRRRALAYTGSCTHFFRCLWADDLEESGFFIRIKKNGKALNYSNVVFEDRKGMKYMISFEDLEVDFYENRSYMSFIKNSVYMERDGYYDPIAIIVSGIMAKQRIADFLPYEYLPGQ